jgi:hypothetical protein
LCTARPLILHVWVIIPMRGEAVAGSWGGFRAALFVWVRELTRQTVVSSADAPLKMYAI